MTKVLDEGNLLFDFSVFQSAEKFDDRQTNPRGMMSVDFVAEDSDCLYFIEVKDFQNPNASKERLKEDFEMLRDAVEKKKAVFNIRMGAKIKDSLLRKYSLGEEITKKVLYILFINLDKLSEHERGLLKAKISGYVPTGLNDSRFCKFTDISFDLVNAEQLKLYGINCTTK